MKPASARLPVSSISRSSPTRASISAHSAPVRPSFQRIAGPQHLAVRAEHDEPVHLPREADRAVGQPRRTASAARHQSSGSCSAQPGCGVESA